MTPLVVADLDPSLATTVRALASRDAGAEIVQVADLVEAAHALGAGGVLIAGSQYASRRGIADLQAFHRDHPAVRTVLAFDRKPGTAMREVVAVGADALVEPTDAAELRVAIDRALRFSREVVPLGALGETADQAGQVVTVLSATGGCGKTFVAANLTAALASWTDARVALVDLDLQFGEVAASLGLRARTSWADLIGAEPDELAEVLDAVLVTHGSGAHVLTAASDPAVADAVDAAQVTAVLEHLRATHDIVLVDTSSGLSEATLAALDVTDQTLLLATLDVASIRNLRTLDRTLDRLQVPLTERRLILNEDRDGVGLTADEVEHVLDRRFVARIPHSATVPRSTNAGRPVLLDDAPDGVAAALVEVLASVAPDPHRDVVLDHRPVPSRGRSSWLDRFRRSGATAAPTRIGRPPVPPLGVRVDADPTPEG